MELRSRTEAVFDRFAREGTLGEGATRAKASFLERTMATGGGMAVDMFLEHDNQAGIDQDARAGFIKADKAKLDAIVNGKIEQGFEELIGPTPDIRQISPEELKEAREALLAMGMSEEEVNQTLNPNAPQPAPEQGTYEGFVEKKDGVSRATIETTGDVHDIEYYVSNNDGCRFMNATDKGDYLEVKATRVDFTGDDSAYTETMILR